MISFIERIAVAIAYLFSIYLLFILLTSSSPLESVHTGEIDKVIKMTMFIMVAIIPILLSLIIYYVKDNRKAERETNTTYLKIVANQEARADKETETLGAIASTLKILEKNQEHNQNALMKDIGEIKSLIIKG